MFSYLVRNLIFYYPGFFVIYFLYNTMFSALWSKSGFKSLGSMNPCPSSDDFAFGVKCYGKLKQGIQKKQNWLQRPEILNALKY